MVEKANDIFVANPNYLKSKSIKDINDLFSKGSFMLLENYNIQEILNFLTAILWHISCLSSNS